APRSCQFADANDHPRDSVVPELRPVPEKLVVSARGVQRCTVRRLSGGSANNLKTIRRFEMEEATTTKVNVDRIRSAYDAFSRGDIAGAFAVFAKDIRWHIP